MQVSSLSAHSSRGLDLSAGMLDAACIRIATDALTHSLDSDVLLQGQKSVNIVHNGTMYRLQATKLGKLILTK